VWWILQIRLYYVSAPAATFAAATAAATLDWPVCGPTLPVANASNMLHANTCSLASISNSWQVVVGGLGPFVTNMLHVSWLSIYLKQFITQWWLATTWLVRISSMVQLELGVWLCVSGH